MPHIHEKIDPVRSRDGTHRFSASNGIDFTVEVFIVYKNRVLLRMHDKFKQWMRVGGHIELNEDPIEAAHREVKEEVGLQIELVGNPKVFESEDHTRELLPPVALNRHRVSDSHEHVTLVYFARAKTDKTSVTYAGDASEECRWCTVEEVEKMELWSNVREYAIAALERLG